VIQYFSDPVLFAPTVGCMLMCLTAACIGVFVVLKKESLLGEALSHAAYPGVILAVLCVQIFLPQQASSDLIDLMVALAGAFFSALAGIYLIRFLQKKKVSQDAALAFVLSSFFGLGMLLLSILQTEYPTLYRQMQALLFGQAATMVHVHVVIYAVLAFFTVLLIVCTFRPLQIVIFDPVFAKSVGISKSKIDALLFFLIVFATVVGIRSVGVVLLSAMLIFPAATARFYVKTVSSFLILSAFFGVLAGFFGVLFSHELSSIYSANQDRVLSFPTGPMIVICATTLFLGTAFFAPKKGLLIRGIRKLTFLLECKKENFLKSIWKFCSENNKNWISSDELLHIAQEGFITRKWLLLSVTRNGWLRHSKENGYTLTPVGMLWGRKLVRLHRLWEVYLVEFCKLPRDRVHPLAEEMEHILTEEMEAELTQLLQDPTKDPHNAPIPAKAVGIL